MRTLAQRYRQAHREAWWAIALTLAYFAWWYLSAYGLAPQSAQHLTLYWGLPLWFLMACVIGPILFCLLCAAMVKWLYKPMSLELEDHPQAANDNASADKQSKEVL
ncbi:hypothetical protein VST7929_00226 [Vibrio stylophorae]|uniref:DUF997 family protein n=1 Tax=Vibrio stylophorae TaxID=659351 RepID=A0ABN8DPB4_9VIBR|nr:YhdT family protein [Vibrio stylophorae]CAH0532397.1 hypothetical protein VST7929_00226 [Vibrio stylophorae]